MDMRDRFIIILFLFFFQGTSAGQTTSKRSITYIPSANGFCYVAYNLVENKVDVFQPHIVDLWDVGQTTPDLIESVEFKLAVRNKRAALSALPVESASYEDGTGIIRVDSKIKDHSLTRYFWTPMVLDYKILLMVCHVENAAFLKLDSDQIEVHLNTSSPDFYLVRMSQIDGRDLWVGAALIYRPGISESTFEQLKDELFQAKPKNLVEAEKRWWRHWHHFQSLPANIYGKLHQAVLQSAVFLKMAQCREPGPSYGQIVSHLSPHYPKVAIVSDMAYAIVALASLGHFRESKAALTFLLRSDAGQFKCRKFGRIKWGLCEDYLISLYYYTGLGHERSVWKNGAPVIHLDGNGLFLWAMHEYVSKSADRRFFYNNEAKIEKQVIYPLVNAIDEEGLIQNDSGWYNLPAPGEHFTLSSASAFKGLNCAAVLFRESGAVDISTELIKTSSQLRNTMLSKLVIGESGVITRSLEQKKWPDFLDGTTVEIINWSVVDPHWKTSLSTLNAMESFLRLAEPSRGFSRDYEQDEKKRSENLFVNLRSVEALNRATRIDRANELLNWIMELISSNTYMISSTLQAGTLRYEGTYPVIGRGAGACILAVFSYSKF